MNHQACQRQREHGPIRAVVTILVFVGTIVGALALAACSTLEPSKRKASQPAVILQLEYQPTFAPIEVMVEAGRLPTFTLYENGTVVYSPQTERGRVLQAQITEEEAHQILDRVTEMGLERLQQFQWEEDQEAADHSYIFLRALQHDTYAEVCIYGGIDLWVRPKELKRILAFLKGYAHPDAIDYAPEAATVFVSQSEMEEADFEWPLDEAYLTPVAENRQSHTAFSVFGGELESLVLATGHKWDFHIASHGDKNFRVFTMPWLPGVDHTDSILCGFRKL